MRTTINIDDAIFAKAQKFFGDMKTGEMVNTAIRMMVEKEAASRMADLGGSDPDAAATSRRSSPGSLMVAEDPALYLGKP